MVQIAIFASGKGSNAANFCRYFRAHPSIRVALIASDRKAAGVFQVAEEAGVEAVYLDPDMIRNPDRIVDLLRQKGITAIVLAGYLKLIPPALIAAFPNRIFNVHPALLPAFGGKGMFGMHVHEAVIAAKATETGITIHYVNEHYDEGAIIFQARVPVTESDTAETVAGKIHLLEMQYFPQTIERLLR